MSNSDLIAEANKALAENQWTSGWGVESLAGRLADALEQAEARLAEAWDEGEQAGYEDAQIFERGLPTDGDAAEHPHRNPYRR